MPEIAVHHFKIQRKMVLLCIYLCEKWVKHADLQVTALSYNIYLLEKYNLASM